MLSHPEWQESPEGLCRSSSKREHWKLTAVGQAENRRCTKRCLHLSISEEEERSGKYNRVRGGRAREMVYDWGVLEIMPEPCRQVLQVVTAKVAGKGGGRGCSNTNAFSQRLRCWDPPVLQCLLPSKGCCCGLTVTGVTIPWGFPPSRAQRTVSQGRDT